MNKREKWQYGLTVCLLVIYLIVLTWIIVLKMGDVFQIYKYGNGSRYITWIPFIDLINNHESYAVSEVIDNMIIFIPFGVYMGILKNKSSFIKKILPIACVSLAFEATQFIFAIGSADTTDIVMNTLGGIVGVGIYYVLRKLFKTDLKTNVIINVFSLIVVVFMIMVIGIAFFNYMMMLWHIK